MSDRLELPPIFQERVVVFDGAMGSLLAERGVSYSHPFEELNISSPHLVCQVHADYIKAGADVIETNTFAANRFKLARHGLENRVTEINLAGARLARSVAGKNALVAGSIGPMGVRMSPIGTASVEDIQNATLQQLNGLLEGEVELIILETQSDLEIACIMLECITQSCRLPIICQFALDTDLATPSGDTLDDIAARLSRYPLSAIGVNCGIGPEQTLRAVQYLREITDVPISAQPNSGFPAQVEGRTLFLSNPDYFAERGAEIVSAGASIVGGCCGTSPAHIEKLAAAVNESAKTPALQRFASHDPG